MQGPFYSRYKNSNDTIDTGTIIVSRYNIRILYNYECLTIIEFMSFHSCITTWATPCLHR